MEDNAKLQEEATRSEEIISILIGKIIIKQFLFCHTRCMEYSKGKNANGKEQIINKIEPRSTWKWYFPKLSVPHEEDNKFNFKPSSQCTKINRQHYKSSFEL